MEIEITKEKENRLLHRTEMEGTIRFERETPSRADIIKYIAAKKNVPENLVVVAKVNQKFGARDGKVDIRIYESESMMKSIEPRYMLKRQAKTPKKVEEPKAEEKKGEEKAKVTKEGGEENGQGK